MTAEDERDFQIHFGAEILARTLGNFQKTIFTTGCHRSIRLFRKPPGKPANGYAVSVKRSNRFCFGLHIVAIGSGYQGAPFDPESEEGPAPANQLHLNNVFCNGDGMFLSGLKTAGMMRFDGRTLVRVATLPRGIHNARPFWPGCPVQ